MITLQEILNKKVSHQDHFWTAVNEVLLKDVLDEIRGPKHEKITSQLRSLYNQGRAKEYGDNKRKLPGVTFCGSFEKERVREKLNAYTQLMVLDIDKLGGAELMRVKAILNEDQYVFSFWESPSKDGIKGLIYLSYNFDIQENGIDHSHKIAFKQLVEYFSNTHDIPLDTSGSDVTRLCFISCDRNLVIKDEIVPFQIRFIPLKQKATSSRKIIGVHNKKGLNNLLYNPQGKNNQHQKRTIKKIIKYLTKNSKSITNSYDEWIRVAYAISDSFTYEVGKDYFLDLSRLDDDKFNEEDCKNTLINCYQNSRGEIGFNSIVHFASEKGFKYKEVEST